MKKEKSRRIQVELLGQRFKIIRRQLEEFMRLKKKLEALGNEVDNLGASTRSLEDIQKDITETRREVDSFVARAMGKERK